MRLWILTVLATLLGLLASPALAERVHVRSAIGEVGHGWLFGSAENGGVACWLAVPRHVTLDASGDPAPFTYTDASGRSAESSRPVAVADVPGAIEAAGGFEDLAFARPANGATGCTSRLGLPDFAYSTLLQTVSQMQVWSMSPASYGPFWVEIDRAQASTQGGRLLLKAVDANAGATYLISGISGGVATADRAGQVVPVAMITEVNGDTGRAVAVRFDLIRKAFERVEAQSRHADAAGSAGVDGVPFAPGTFAAIVQKGAPSALVVDGECWQVLPEGGQRVVSLEVTLGAEAQKTAGLTLATSACGTAGDQLIVEQKAPGASAWTPAASCQTVESIGEAPACRFDLRTPRTFRLKIVTTGAVGLDRLRFY